MICQVTVSTMADGPIASARMTAKSPLPVSKLSRRLVATVIASDDNRRNVDYSMAKCRHDRAHAPRRHRQNRARRLALAVNGHVLGDGLVFRLHRAQRVRHDPGGVGDDEGVAGVGFGLSRDPGGLITLRG